MSAEDIKKLAEKLKFFSNGSVEIVRSVIARDCVSVFENLESDVESPYKVPLIATVANSKKFVLLDGAFPVDKSEKIYCDLIKDPLSSIEVTAFRLFLSNRKNISLKLKYKFFTDILKNNLENDIQQLLSLTGFSKSDVTNFSELCECDADVIETVLSGAVNIKLAKDFNFLKGEDRKSFLGIFSHLNLSYQYQREFLEWLPEISFVKKTSIAEILTDSEIITILSDDKKNPPQKTSAIRKRLYEVRFPKYSKAVSVWNKASSKLGKLNKSVTVKRDPYFEDENIELTIRVKNLNELHSAIKDINSVDNENWNSLFDPFSV